MGDQCHIGSKPEKSVEGHDTNLEIVILPLVIWVLCYYPAMARKESVRVDDTVREAVKDYERCASTLAEMHTIAFASLLLRNVANLVMQSE